MTDVFHTHHDGLSTLVTVPEISEDYPPEIREALTRRRMLALGQPCPCGARPFRLNRSQRREIAARRRRGLPAPVIRALVEHEDGCCATDEALAKLADRHGLKPVWWNL